MQDALEEPSSAAEISTDDGSSTPAPPPHRMRVAVLDDEPAHLDLIRRVAQSLGHECLLFTRGRDLMHQLQRESVDLLIIDWHLPDITGVEVVRWVRARIQHAMPIIIVTNRIAERDVVTGLASGADDYMTKPLRVMELTARVQALLRRSYPAAQRSIQRHGPYTFDLHARQAFINGVAVELKNKEFELACCMFSHLGRLLTRGYLRQTIWGSEVEIPSRSLDTHVSTLRNKLGLRPEQGYRLISVYGQGYRLEALGAQTDAQ